MRWLARRADTIDRGTPTARLAEGDYQTLLAWLTENFYRHGRAYGTDELLTRATGEGLNTAPLLDYLEGKYTDLYGLN